MPSTSCVLCVLTAVIGLSRAVPQTLQPEVVLGQENSARSLDCFNTYLPLLNQIAEDYKAEYAKCDSSAEKDRISIDESTTYQRNEFNDSANGACAALTKCSENTAFTEYFDCYTKTASETSKTMFTLSADSAEVLAAVQEEYRQVESNENKCTSAADRDYMEKQASVYEDFDRCNKGAE